MSAQKQLDTREGAGAPDHVRESSHARPGAAAPSPRDPFIRAENEDDDGYDPYSDYVGMLSRVSCEEPEADPWR